MNVYRGSIYDCQKLGYLNGWTVISCDGILYSREGTINNMQHLGWVSKCYVEWKKPVLEDYVLYNFIKWHCEKDKTSEEYISGSQKVWRGCDYKGISQGSFWDFGTGLYPDCSSGYTIIYMC